jgi:hypothetical protein
MKDFTLYAEALAIKELGFDKPCLGRWLVITKWEKPTGEVRLQIGFNAETWDKNQCFAPTYSQAFRFFREEYDLDIDISRNDQEMIDYVERKGEKYLPKYKYGYSNGTFISIGTCMKYEEAEVACLRKLIAIVKNKSI